MTDFLATLLELRREEIRQQLQECHEPTRYKLLMAEFQQTMSAIVGSQQPIDPTLEIQARRANGEVATADLLEQSLALIAAEANLREAQARFQSTTGLAHSNAEKALQAAQEAVERAQAPTPNQAAQIERDRRDARDLVDPLRPEQRHGMPFKGNAPSFYARSCSGRLWRNRLRQGQNSTRNWSPRQNPEHS